MLFGKQLIGFLTVFITHLFTRYAACKSYFGETKKHKEHFMWISVVEIVEQTLLSVLVLISKV